MAKGAMQSSTNPKRLVYLTAVALILIIGPFLFGYHFRELSHASAVYLSSTGLTTFGGASATKGFHLILPATGPNLDFCKLVLSAAITGYPEPIFVGWDGKGMFNGTESHLFKITETLAYLHSLPASQDDDMVLVLDAYDIWLQLRPDVLFSRYHSVLRKNDERLRQDGTLNVDHGGAKVRSSIVFGPDKIHWPQHSDEAAVWAVPDSMMDNQAFGPDTDTDMFTARPRWLNSGTIMGPVSEMRDMFAATVDMLSKRYDASFEFRTSDQYYFAEVWGEQEVGRLRLKQGDNFTVPKDVGEGRPAKLPPTGWSNEGSGKRTEFGMTLDYETELFQTAAAYDRHLTWMRFNGSTSIDDAHFDRFDEAATQGRRMDQWTLSADVLESDSPFPTTVEELPSHLGWEEVMLGTNVVTAAVFPLFHVTGDKSLRGRWWPRMWFHPWAEPLLRAAKRKQASRKDPTVFLEADGVKWKIVRPDGYDLPVELSADEKGGAWTDSGEYVPWQDMCGSHEDELFLREQREDL